MYFVGVTLSGERNVLKTFVEEGISEGYAAMIGPFRSKNGAWYYVDHIDKTPCLTVSEADRLGNIQVTYRYKRV